MKIFVVGPKHSGKTVFINHLMNLLPTERIRRVEGCPDGESLWSSSPNAEEVELVRQKGEHSDRYIQNTIKRINLCDERIAIIDIGGKLNSGEKIAEGAIDRIEENNKLIFSQGDAFIVVSGDKQKTKEWIEFFDKKVISNKTLKPLRCLAKITTFNPDDPEYKDKKSTMVEPEGEVLCANMYGLKRSQKLTDDQQLVFKQIMSMLLDVTKDEAKPASHYDVDGYDLAEKAGVVKYVSEDKTKYCRRILFPRDRTAEIYEAIEGMDFERQMETGEPVTVGNLYNGRVTVAVCDALRKWKSKSGKIGIRNVEVFDEISKKSMPIKEIEEQKESNAHFCIMRGSMLAMHKIESLGASFLNIDVYGDDLSDRDYLDSLKIPNLEKNKVLYISGRIPHYLLASICLSSHVETIYTYTPGAGFTCVKHDVEVDKTDGEQKHWVGKKIADIKEVENSEGINITKFFLDRKRDSKTSGMDYVREELFTLEELDELEALNLPNNMKSIHDKRKSHSKKVYKKNTGIREKIVKGELRTIDVETKSRKEMVKNMISNSQAKRVVNLKSTKKAVEKDERSRKKR